MKRDYIAELEFRQEQHTDLVNSLKRNKQGAFAWTAAEYAILAVHALGATVAVAGMAIAEAIKPRRLARKQPCGCVVCHCDEVARCNGCGAQDCGAHEPGEIPDPVYEG